MYQIGILTRPDRFLLKIRSSLAQTDKFKATILNKAFTTYEVLKSQSLDGIVVVLDSFDEMPLEMIRKLRVLFQLKPIILTSHRPTAELIQEIAPMKNTILITSESEIENLGVTLEKMFSGKSVKNREFKRHKTMQTATLSGSKHTSGPALLLDLAVGGAQVRSFSGQWKKGDTLDLHIPLPGLNKSHLMKSQIVWAKEERLLTQEKVSSLRLGLKFVDI